VLFTPVVATETHLEICDIDSINRNQLLHIHTMPAIDRLQWQDLPASFGQSRQSTSAASIDDGTTGFSSLPRELRDDIYDSLYLEDEQKPDGLSKAEIIDGPKNGSTVYTRTRVPQARLVSQRFKSGYEERPASRNRAQWTSNGMPQCWDFTPGPTISSQCTELEIDFYHSHQMFGPCVWCQGTQFIAYMSLRRLNFLVHGKPLLKRIHIRLHCSGSDLVCDGSTSQLEYQRCMVESVLTGVDAYALAKTLRYRESGRLNQLDVDVSWHGKEHGSLENCFATWTHQRGLQTDVDAAIRCQKRIYKV
jgi:hypothetical protein